MATATATVAANSALPPIVPRSLSSQSTTQPTFPQPTCSPCGTLLACCGNTGEDKHARGRQRTHRPVLCVRTRAHTFMQRCHRSGPQRSSAPRISLIDWPPPSQIRSSLPSAGKRGVNVQRPHLTPYPPRAWWPSVGADARCRGTVAADDRRAAQLGAGGRRAEL
jgi:hypothetical protein